MRAVGLAGLVFTTALAGCLAGDDPAPLLAYPVTDTWEECDMTAIAFLHEKQDVRPVLPPGWEPGDAQGLFGTPMETGRALAVAFVGACGNVALAQGPLAAADLFVMVEPPVIDGADPGPAFRDFYLPVEYANDPDFLAFLADTGYNGTNATVTLDVSLVGPVATVQASVADAQGEVFAVGAQLAPAPFPDESQGSRFWQEVPGGLAYYEISFPNTAFNMGPLTTCRARPGSVAEAVLGGVDCTGQESFLIAAQGMQFPYEFQFFPGATVQP